MRAAQSAPARGRLLIACLALLFCSGAAEAPRDGTQSVVASRSGFRPQTLNGRKGEALHLRLTTADEEHCFAVDTLRIEKRIVPGRATAVELIPERAGTFDVTCCLHAKDAERARLVVVE